MFVSCSSNQEKDNIEQLQNQIISKSQEIEMLKDSIKRISITHFNRFEPFAVAKNHSIKQGENLELLIGHFTYNSNESSKIQFWIDDSTGTPETMIAFSGPNGNGKIEIDQEHYPHALTKGEHFIRGMVESTEKGEKKWGYWKLDYKVE